MKYTLLIATLFLVSWKTIPFKTLAYSDFKGHGSTAANTASCIDLSYEESGGRYTFSVSCYFVPQESWINVKTPEVLAHENTHWKISILYARQVQRICNTFKNCDSIRAEQVRAMYDKIITEWQTTQAKFDEETAHSVNRQSELEWESKINNQLKQLK